MAQEVQAPQGARPPQQSGPRQWRCLTCQYVVASEILPFRCLRCGASRVKMLEVGASSNALEE